MWGQGDQATGHDDNRDEIITIMSILIGYCRSWQSFSINQLYEKICLLNSF